MNINVYNILTKIKKNNLDIFLNNTHLQKKKQNTQVHQGRYETPPPPTLPESTPIKNSNDVVLLKNEIVKQFIYCFSSQVISCPVWKCPKFKGEFNNYFDSAMFWLIPLVIVITPVIKPLIFSLRN